VILKVKNGSLGRDARNERIVGAATFLVRTVVLLTGFAAARFTGAFLGCFCAVAFFVALAGIFTPF
jgi:hypothetical protein